MTRGTSRAGHAQRAREPQRDRRRRSPAATTRESAIAQNIPAAAGLGACRRGRPRSRARRRAPSPRPRAGRRPSSLRRRGPRAPPARRRSARRDRDELERADALALRHADQHRHHRAERRRAAPRSTAARSPPRGRTRAARSRCPPRPRPRRATSPSDGPPWSLGQHERAAHHERDELARDQDRIERQVAGQPRPGEVRDPVTERRAGGEQRRARSRGGHRLLGALLAALDQPVDVRAQARELRQLLRLDLVARARQRRRRGSRAPRSARARARRSGPTGRRTRRCRA